MSLTLSLFPGIGLLDMAFEQEGFCVVRGPDVIWGGDIRRFHPTAGHFDGVMGGPPCQSFSSLAHLVRANGHEPIFGNLIPEFERCVLEAQPRWFLMENVPQAPTPFSRKGDDSPCGGYGVNSFLLDNSALNDGTGFGLEQRRIRRFSFGLRERRSEHVPCLLRWIDLAVFLLPDASRTATSYPVNNSQDAKRRLPAVTSTDGGERPSEKKRVPAVNSGHDDPNVSLTLARRERKKAVSSSNGGNGGGKEGRLTAGAGNAGKGRYRLADALRLQGLPEDFLDHCPFTAEGKLKAIANGVPIPMGLAIARAVKCATADEPKERTS
jgi:site-specific DNA-cytosine methylase